ncbi:leucine zipper domain-containing protein [Aurantimicrobium minutum]|uniref:leucine zipper domain-containing protein n=1 Tax=Aurantimicrobium minutum TaxID=708131 RepID=UPI00248DC9B9|nr:leucine zipper domain-containing protein [Aurantimicrobium minutum]
MNKARLIITAINFEKITQVEAVRRYGVSQSWVSKLLHRHRSEGEAAFTPKSKRPHNTPTATPQSTIDLIREIRATLEKAGHDAGIINPRNERIL